MTTITTPPRSAPPHRGARLHQAPRSRAANPCCPRCDATPCIRWGSFNGRQRYRCRSCRRTFTELTATPFAFAKKFALLPAFAGLSAEGASLRSAAARLGIHPCTAFRWRHTLLRALRDCDRAQLVGWIELTGLRLALNEKGSRALARPARRRGFPPGSSRALKTVHVVVACDRSSHRVTAVVGPSPTPPSSRDLEGVLGDRIGARPLLIADSGRYGPAGVLARRRQGVFRPAREYWRGSHVDPVTVGTARSYARQLVVWLRRFRGVATSYLENYLAWHRAHARPGPA